MSIEFKRRRHPGSTEKRLEDLNLATVFDLFPNRHPFELEIGSGKGRFLLERAAKHPGRNFLGIDYAWRFLREGHQRIAQRGLENLRFYKAEAGDVVRILIPDESVDIFHIYFPDPWPKRQQRKRRLLTPEFFQLLHQRLKTGGRLELATDNFQYLVFFKKSLVEAGDALWRDVRESQNERLLDPEILTHFEAKYRREGRVLYYIELTK
ncbi:MAG TPA: tRNA (guanosine(46)-N7)-methyltransferase TrmB [Candidatus Krumholzibacteria bacterium]|nr:tRNA (guanosine(46)-N7)-methyltransferase TrmB [Candidatus Krumholzibacteria bacterium]